MRTPANETDLIKLPNIKLFRLDILDTIDNYVRVTLENSQKAGADAPGPVVVAAKIFAAANDRSFQLRYPVLARKFPDTRNVQSNCTCP